MQIAITYLLPEKKLCSLNPNLHIRVSVSDFYIPTVGPPIFLQQNRQTDRWNICINRLPKHECRNWKKAVSFLGIFVSNFRCSAFVMPVCCCAGQSIRQMEEGRECCRSPAHSTSW
jgi:hypothetical protein